MQTPTEIYARWQPEPNSKMSHWIDTLYNLVTELEQLQELRQQRMEEREVATKQINAFVAMPAEKEYQYLLNNLALLDRVIARTSEEIARLREREYTLEQTLNAAATRLAASTEAVQSQLCNTLQSRQLETFDTTTFLILQDSVTGILENQTHRKCVHL